MKYTSVIFDLDGTLCDTLYDIHASLNSMLRERGYPEHSFEHTKSGINRGSRYLIAHALPEGSREDEIDAALEHYMKIYSEHVCDATVPYEGIIPLLYDLRRAGISLAVLSNKPDELVAVLAERLFHGMFAITIGDALVDSGHDAYPKKPSPVAPLAIAHTFGTSPENVLLVGDSDVDIQTAHNAGMTAVGVTWGYRDPEVLILAGADHIVSAPADIYKIIIEGETK